MTSGKRAACLAAVACLACAGLFLAQESVEQDLDKPLRQFTIGDLFPNLAGAMARQTGEIWTESGSGLRRMADGRRQGLAEALSRIKERIASLKADVKAARRSKDFTATGAAEGKLETEQAVQSILKRLDRVTDSQSDVGRAWQEAGEAMLAFATAEETFDSYRSAGIAKPASDPNYADTRLDEKGISAFRREAEAMDDLGVSLAVLGNEIRALVDDRQKFLSELERGGHVKTPALR